ncbi:MAG: hypothetical protein EP315_00325 [Gammaproteobacteria bacterium]|nr:MAG: hypothetical protein EP315_00325 [Gammaproteobacteria bacterium]
MALDIAGIEIADVIQINNTSLQLNGAGIREKLFTDIYVGALYLEKPSTDINEIILSEKTKRIALHFIYREVTAEKLVEGWNDGFRLNLDTDEYDQLQPRLQQSYDFFETMKTGDVVYLDYVPDIGTRLTINNRLKGTIPGADFYQAVLKVWIGEYPAQEKLKLAMLGSLKTANTAW